MFALVAHQRSGSPYWLNEGAGETDGIVAGAAQDAI